MSSQTVMISLQNMAGTWIFMYFSQQSYPDLYMAGLLLFFTDSHNTFREIML